MPHIHTEAGQHDQTVSAYIVRRDGDEVYIMLHMHRKLHKLLPVGGHVELNETPWSAMAHELTEESGYSVDELALLQPKIRIEKLDKVVLHPQPFVVQTHDVTPGHYHTDLGYIFVAETHPRGRVADGESEDIRWFTRDGIERLSEQEIYHDTKQMCLEIFDKFFVEWQLVAAAEFSTSSSTID